MTERKCVVIRRHRRRHHQVALVVLTHSLHPVNSIHHDFADNELPLFNQPTNPTKKKTDRTMCVMNL